MRCIWALNTLWNANNDFIVHFATNAQCSHFIFIYISQNKIRIKQKKNEKELCTSNAKQIENIKTKWNCRGKEYINIVPLQMQIANAFWFDHENIAFILKCLQFIYGLFHKTVVIQHNYFTISQVKANQNECVFISILWWYWWNRMIYWW